MKDEIGMAIRKASRVDNISTEMIQAGGESLMSMMCTVCNETYTNIK